MSSSKDSAKLIRMAKGQGWTIERRKKKFRLTSPSGFVVVVAFTPSHDRTYRNTLSLMKKGGLVI